MTIENELNFSEMSIEKLEDVARRASYRAFRAKVLQDAKGIIEDLELTKENQDEKSDDLYQRICEECDSAVIYHKDCYLIVYACDGDEQDEIFEHMGSEALNGCESANDAIGKMAYWSYQKALTDCIHSNLE